MSVYLDANVLVAVQLRDALTDRVELALQSIEDDLLVSDFAAAEFAAVVTRRFRMRDLDEVGVKQAFANFDRWCAKFSQRIDMTGPDIRSAEHLTRQINLTLRAPDAVHLASAMRLGAQLLTFDAAMIAAAQLLGLPLAA